jgi:hypothetical protein
MRKITKEQEAYIIERAKKEGRKRMDFLFKCPNNSDNPFNNGCYTVIRLSDGSYKVRENLYEWCEWNDLSYGGNNTEWPELSKNGKISKSKVERDNHK